MRAVSIAYKQVNYCAREITYHNNESQVLC